MWTETVPAVVTVVTFIAGAIFTSAVHAGIFTRFWGSAGDDEFPNQCLRLMFDQRHGIGAVHFCGPTVRGEDGIWVTRVPSPLTDSPTLYYDSDSDTEFPVDAVHAPRGTAADRGRVRGDRPAAGVR